MLQDLTEHLNERQDKSTKFLSRTGGLSIDTVRKRPGKLVELDLQVAGIGAVAHAVSDANEYKASGPTIVASPREGCAATASRYRLSSSRLMRCEKATPDARGSSSTYSPRTTGPSAARRARPA